MQYVFSIGLLNKYIFLKIAPTFRSGYKVVYCCYYNGPFQISNLNTRVAQNKMSKET